MIGYRDFSPSMEDRGGFFKMPSMETLAEALERANQWVEADGIEVINIETVVLPNIHLPHEEGTEDPQILVGESGAWYQFIRVWYRK